MRMSLSASRLKKPIVIALIALMCIVLAVSMGVTIFAAKPPKKKLTGKIKIGALLPLTGDLAWLGEESEAAIEFAVEEVNELLKEAGAPWRLRVLFRDTEGDPDVALKELKKLFKKDGVRFVIGPMLSRELGPIIDSSFPDDNKILMVSQSSTSPVLNITDFVFRFVPTDPVQGLAIARLMNETGIGRVVAVYRDDEWGTRVLEATATRFEALGGTFVGDVSYPPEEEYQDFEAVAADLSDMVVAEGADGVLHIGFEEAVDLFKNASAYEELQGVKWYGSEGTALSERLIEDLDAAEFCDATEFTSPYIAPPTCYKFDKVHGELLTVLGRDPHPYAYVAYDIVWALAYSLSIVNRYDSVAVREILPKVAESLSIVLNEAGDRAFMDYDLWRIVYEDDEYKWKDVGTYHGCTDTIT